MALLGNYAIFTKNPINYAGGDSTSGIQGLRYNFNQAGVSRLRFYGDNDVDGVTDRCGLPANYSAPYSWILPPKSGGVGSNVGLSGLGAFTGSGALGMNIESTLSGSGTISDANLGLILSAVATLSGIGGLSADIVGTLDAAATLAGQGDFTASLGALAGAVATLSGTSTMSGDINALASISADIYVNQSEASVQQIVDGVWNALAASYNTSGTMGEAAQTGGGGGGGATAAQIWAYSDRTLTESAGLTTEQAGQLTQVYDRVDKKISNISAGFIGGNRTDYGVSDRADLKSIKDAIAKIKPQEIDTSKIESKIDNVKSHIDIAKNSIIDTIKSSTDSLETEITSDIVRKTKELKEDNVSTRNLIREKTKKIDENVSKLADRQEMTDKMIENESEEIESEIERILQEEAQMIELEIDEQLNKEADEIEKTINQETNGNT